MSKDLWDLPLSTDSPRRAEQYVLAVSYGEDWWFLNVHGFACTEADKRKRGRRLAATSQSGCSSDGTRDAQRWIGIAPLLAT